MFVSYEILELSNRQHRPCHHCAVLLQRLAMPVKRTGLKALRLARTRPRRRRQPLPPLGAEEASARSRKKPAIRRLLAGRTLAVLQSLRNCTLFHARDDSGLFHTEPLRPAAGLTATLEGQPVMIVDVSKNGTVAVAEIVAKKGTRALRGALRGATHVLSRRTTQRCCATALKDVGVPSSRGYSASNSRRDRHLGRSRGGGATGHA